MIAQAEEKTPGMDLTMPMSTSPRSPCPPARLAARAS
jgi:hypothetical protein